ncbi:MAG: type II/IV secretion system protein [Rubrobacteraceae bacterium]
MRSFSDASQRVSPERMANILVAEGKIPGDQMRVAFREHLKTGRSLDETLVADGYVAAEDLARTVSGHLNVEYVVLAGVKVPPELAGVVEEEVLRQCEAVPIRLENESLVVAMEDPGDLEARGRIAAGAGHPMITVAAATDAIRSAREKLFWSWGDRGWRNRSQASGLGRYGGYEPADPVEMYPLEIGRQRAGYATGEVRGPDGVAEEPSEYPGWDTERKARDEPATAGSPRRGNLVGGGGLADFLASEGRISEDQYRSALGIQKRDDRRMEEVLISLGYVSKVDLARSLARLLRLEFVEVGVDDIDQELVSLVGQRVLRRHTAVPLRVEDGRLVVAMSDPRDIYALEDLRIISGYPISPVVATEDDIHRVQSELFGLGEGVTEFLEEATNDTGPVDEGEIQLGAESGAHEAPIIRLVSSIMRQAVGDGASDIHVEPQSKEVVVRFRVDGVLREVMTIPRKLQGSVIARIKVVANLDIAERRVPQDGRFSVRIRGDKIDLRVATLPTAYGEKIVLRLLDTSRVETDLARLGFSAEAFGRYEEVFRRPYGAILVTGPTGSGKSTTLYATLNELNSPGRNIITIEDPIEYRVQGLNQIQVNPRAGLTFASGLRSILRSDPDVIMIGEIRDGETANISVESALTGHLVLATLHTNDAPGALTRLTEMGVEPFLTSSAVDCVIAQRLARRLCERCKEPKEITREVLEKMDFPFQLLGKRKARFYGACGCQRCGGTGYRGRLGIFEVMVVTDSLKERVLRRDSATEISKAAEQEGMVRLRDDGLIKAAEGVTTVEEVLRTVV